MLAVDINKHNNISNSNTIHNNTTMNSINS